MLDQLTLLERLGVFSYETLSISNFVSKCWRRFVK